MVCYAATDNSQVLTAHHGLGFGAGGRWETAQAQLSPRELVFWSGDSTHSVKCWPAGQESGCLGFKFGLCLLSPVQPWANDLSFQFSHLQNKEKTSAAEYSTKTRGRGAGMKWEDISQVLSLCLVARRSTGKVSWYLLTSSSGTYRIGAGGNPRSLFHPLSQQMKKMRLGVSCWCL